MDYVAELEETEDAKGLKQILLESFKDYAYTINTGTQEISNKPLEGIQTEDGEGTGTTGIGQADNISGGKKPQGDAGTLRKDDKGIRPKRPAGNIGSGTGNTANVDTLAGRKGRISRIDLT